MNPAWLDGYIDAWCHHPQALDDLGVATMLQKNYGDAKGYFEQSIQAADRAHAVFPAAQQHLALDRQYLGLQ